MTSHALLKHIFLLYRFDLIKHLPFTLIQTQKKIKTQNRILFIESETWYVCWLVSKLVGRSVGGRLVGISVIISSFASHAPIDALVYSFVVSTLVSFSTLIELFLIYSF